MVCPNASFPTVTVSELFISGDLNFDEANESRVREYLVESTDGTTIRPHEVAHKECVPSLPGIGEAWPAYESGLDPKFLYSVTGPTPAHRQSPLLVRRVDLTQMTPDSVRATVFYSTEPDLWAVRRSVESTTVSGRITIDWAARGQPDASDFGGEFGCRPFGNVQVDEFSEALPKGLEGVPIQQPKHTLVLSGLFLLDENQMQLISGDIGTIARFGVYGPLPGEQVWFFAGVFGPELRKTVMDDGSPTGQSVWQLEFRFEFDAFHHRLYFPMTESGNLSNLPVPNPNHDPQNPQVNPSPVKCRSVLPYPISDWRVWASILGWDQQNDPHPPP